jgi:diketogulonate reductase-like aldo/keto reductase
VLHRKSTTTCPLVFVPLATLSKGVNIPLLGDDVSPVNELGECEWSASGYRLIDTAAHGDETVVGNAIRNAGVSSTELFISISA